MFAARIQSWASWASLALALHALPAAAAPGSSVELSPTQVLRQITLDLMHRPPACQEFQALGEGKVDEALVRELVESPDAEAFLRRYHADLLWPAFDPFSVVSYFVAGLLPAGFYEWGGDVSRYFLLATGFYQRGGFVPCKDEPAEFDASGQPIMEEWFDGTLREGWVWVEPYWAPGTQVKVCALEAREMAFGTSGEPCAAGFTSMLLGGCGCGPQLQRCVNPDTARLIEDSLREQLLRAALRPIREGTPYFSMLTDRREAVNGPLVHYYRHLVASAVEPIVYQPPVPEASLPNLEFTDPSWVDVERGPHHSGILTQILFLLRFQTARSRAARFADAFLCSPYVAADVALPSPSDPCTLEPDLRLRCGCASCHAGLEPASAHWGRFSEAGALYLRPDLFPEFRAVCATCAATDTCDFVCERFYFTQAGHPKEEAYLGSLKSLVFRDQADLDNMAIGPKALVEKHLASGQLAQCTAARVAERLLGRPLDESERAGWLPEITAEFAQSGFDFQQLVTSVLMDSKYRRLER